MIKFEPGKYPAAYNTGCRYIAAGDHESFTKLLNEAIGKELSERKLEVQVAFNVTPTAAFSAYVFSVGAGHQEDATKTWGNQTERR